MKTAIGSILLSCIIIAPLHAGAESAGILVIQGNELYAAGAYDKALEAYDKAMTEQPGSGEVFFNKGNVFFQKGEYDQAREAYQSAALHTKDLSLEASAHYNLGNTIYADGQKRLESDPRKALSQWEQSIHHYQEALRIDPHLKEAAQNIEVVRLAMKDLADRIKKAEDAAREQQNQPDDSKANPGQCPNPQTGDRDSPEEAGDKEGEKTAPKDPSTEQTAKESNPAQQQPAEATSQSGEKEDGEEADGRKMGTAFSESPESILREEKENRLQLHRAPRGAYKPVEKDW